VNSVGAHRNSGPQKDTRSSLAGSLPNLGNLGVKNRLRIVCGHAGFLSQTLKFLIPARSKETANSSNKYAKRSLLLSIFYELEEEEFTRCKYIFPGCLAFTNYFVFPQIRVV
jgi:hypothetical protein